MPPVVSVPTKHTFLAPRLMLGKPPGPRRRSPNAWTLTFPRRIDLGEGEAGDVDPASVVEVEHVRLVDQRLIVEPGSTVVAGSGNTAEDPLLNRQHEQVRDILFLGDGTDVLADSEAEVRDLAAPELEERPSGDHLAHIEGYLLERSTADPCAPHPRSRGSSRCCTSGSGPDRGTRSRSGRPGPGRGVESALRSEPHVGPGR